MAPAEIPGFYFDPEKKKYFKVIANHELGKGAKYSKDNVKKATEKQRDDEARAASVIQARQQRVRRARILQHKSVPTACLNRELGASSADRRRTTTDLVALLSGFSLDAFDCFPSRFREDGTITALAHDSKSQTTLFGWTCGDEYKSQSTLWTLLREPSDTGGPTQSQLDLQYAEQSTINSINILSQPNCLVTATLGDSRPPCVSVFPIPDPDDFIFSLSSSDFTRQELFAHGGGSIWTSSASTSLSRFSSSTSDHLDQGPPQNDAVAFGTSSGLGTMGQSLWGSENVRTSSLPKSDVWACEWISPAIVAAGYRNAEVWLYDVRVDEGVLRLRHGGAVTGIKKAREQNQLVVCGLNDSLSMYDLRFTTAPGTKHDFRPHKRRRRNDHSRPPKSQALIDFPYLNSYIHPIGFDVHSPTGLVAAAEDTGMVQLYSLQTGTKLASQQVPQSDKYPAEVQWARNLVFADDGWDTGGPRLLGSAGRQIFEIGW